jgi:hypothetical protein
VAQVLLWFLFLREDRPKKILSSMLFHLWHTWCTRLKVSGLKKCRSRHLTVLPVPAPGEKELRVRLMQSAKFYVIIVFNQLLIARSIPENTLKL